MSLEYLNTRILEYVYFFFSEELCSCLFSIEMAVNDFFFLVALPTQLNCQIPVQVSL